MAKYWIGGALNSNWNENTGSVSNWSATSGGTIRVAPPIAGDNVFFDSNSPSDAILTASTTIRSLDTTGFTHQLTHNSGVVLTIAGGASGVNTFLLSSTMTYTLGNAKSSSLKFTTINTVNITTNGKTLGDITFDDGGAGGFCTLQDNLTSTGGVYLASMTLNTNNKNVSSLWLANSDNLELPILTMGSTIWTLTGSDVDNPAANANAGTLNFINTIDTTFTFNAGTGTFKFTDSTSNTKTISWQATTIFYNMWLSGTGTGTFMIQAFNNATFNDFKCDNPPHTISFNNGITYTVNTFTVNGTAGNLITLISGASGSFFTLSKSSGTISCDYLSIKDSHAVGGANWYAGTHSTNVSGNSGWVFTVPPSIGNPAFFLHLIN